MGRRGRGERVYVHGRGEGVIFGGAVGEGCVCGVVVGGMEADASKISYMRAKCRRPLFQR